MIEAGEADVSLRLQVALTALAAGAKLDPPIDPQPWIDEAEQAATELRMRVDDELARNELDWQLGLAYLYATEISHRRAAVDEALKFGAWPKRRSSRPPSRRKELPDTEVRHRSALLPNRRRVCGAPRRPRDGVPVVRPGDRAAVNPVPVTELAAPGHHGDALVSMGVSYWEIGDRERAYELTGAGVELVEQGIAEGLLAARRR